MSKMVEHVARALAPLAWAALGTGDTLANKSRRTASLRHARNAIAAMREPTESMTVDGFESIDFATAAGSCREAFERTQTIWRTMIDAALAQSDRSPKGRDPTSGLDAKRKSRVREADAPKSKPEGS